MNSPVYTQTLTVNKTTTVKARAFTTTGKASRIRSLELRKATPSNAIKAGKTASGLTYKYFEGDGKTLPDFSTLQPVQTGVTALANLDKIPHRSDLFGLVLEGYIEVAKEDIYTFFLNSDDGSRMYIDGNLLIDHYGDHGAIKKTEQIMLAAGKHRIKLEYFENHGSEYLQAGFIDPELGVKPFTPV